MVLSIKNRSQLVQCLSRGGRRTISPILSRVRLLGGDRECPFRGNLAIIQEALYCAFERGQQNSPLRTKSAIKEGTFAWRLHHETRIKARSSRKEPGQAQPRDADGTGEMPKALLAIDQQVQSNMHEIWDVSRRDDVPGRCETAISRKGLEKLVGEVITIARAEERACPNHQCPRMSSENRLFCHRLTRAV